MTELIDLPGTTWQVWSTAVLRAAGFPATGLDRLTTPDCADVTDAYLAGDADEAAFDAAYDKALTATHRELLEVAADPRFREAVTWQNPTALVALDKLLEAGPDARSNNKRRERERIVARYWTRYCGKNDTIGFFGPVCWVGVDDAPHVVTGRPGPQLIRQRAVEFEWWALTAFVDSFLDDDIVRGQFPLARQPHSAVVNGILRRAGHTPLPVSRAEALLLDAADGRPATAVAADLAADPATGFRKADDVLLLAESLVDRELLRWRLDLPYDLHAERFLREWIADAPADVRQRVGEAFDRLSAARDSLAAAAGDPDRVRGAIETLDREFERVTGSSPRQRHGETYAGRLLCYEDATRGLDVTFGRHLLEALAAPLDILLRAARWLTSAIADAYHAALVNLFDELSDGAPVRFDELWVLANGLMYGDGERPVDAVIEEFQARWAALVGDERDHADPGRVDRTAAELSPRAATLFAAERPGWSRARLHSPDLQILAGSFAELARGEFTAVLGELHASWLTSNAGVLTRFCPDRAAYLAAVERDLGRRALPLYRPGMPLLTARTAEELVGDTDVRVALWAAPTWDRDRTVSSPAMTVSIVDGTLVADTPDGDRWPVLELLAYPLSTLAVNAFKVVDDGDHSPRVTIDRLVVTRETWRTTIERSGILDGATMRDRYVATRRFRRAHGLPDRVFAKIGTEIKPFYVDFTSPVSVGALCSTMAAARTRDGSDVTLTFTELLPSPDQAWVPDANGRRYHSELRLHLRDPEPAATMQEVTR